MATRVLPKALAAGVVLALGVAAACLAGDRPANVSSDAWTAAGTGAVEVLIVLREKADLSLAESLTTREDRALFVVAALRATAERTQKALLADLRARSIEHRSFYVANVVWARADRGALEAVASRPEVDRIAWNPRVKGLGDLLPGRGALGASLGSAPAPGDDAPRPMTVEWNVTLIGAPAAWAEGHRGEGIVVGNQDTGQRWTHQALKGHYRGWDSGTGTANHDYNWHDAIHPPMGGGRCGTDSPEPCDDGDHGTHTMGTVVGDDGLGNEIGLAPDAKWIGCRNMDQGYGTPATYLECFEFFLAPYPVGGDPSMGDPLMAPDLTTNSWLCPPSEGCAWDVLQDAAIAQRAAGIMTVVAAGNSGSGCGSIDIPAGIYDSVYTIGASDSADNMAGFSSRGPSQPEGLSKPDVVAPGVGVRSSTGGADDSFAAFSGTSMATPNAAGVVALLWSARPTYRGRVDETEALLDATARRLPTIVESCGGDYVNGPNGTWGHGRIDLGAALAAACEPAETRCDDAFDGDCDGLVDCVDPDCVGVLECPERRNCTDSVDNDGDGPADCDDDDCDGNPACAEVARCADSRDNDGDGDVDCADRDCDGDAACPEAGRCADAADNDLDGAVDCDDADCDGDAACPEAGRCADVRDNDLDGAVDCDDADCDGSGGCLEAGRCADARDNDGDGDADCDDRDCDGDAACPEAGRCFDAVDNDLDGDVDCEDRDCDGDATCPEAAWCSDDEDNDLDGATDCADRDCDGTPECPESASCADGADNDADGLIDCGDRDCDGDAACPESASCGDSIDNDVDGLVDCMDRDCDGSPLCPEAGRCADSVDNDLDGAVDCLDADCMGAVACPETGNCTDGVDDDGNGLVDCADPQCSGDPACPEWRRCSDGLDNDLDGATDCLDFECVADPVCAASDYDRDGSPNGVDCRPVDPLAFAEAPEVGWLRVTRQGALVRLDFEDVAAAGGVGTRYEVAASPLASARSGVMPCIVRGLPLPRWSVASTSPDEAFLARAVTACGPAAGQLWGSSSFGVPFAACP